MALGYAAVPRDGLGPSAPPLCRVTERHANPLLLVVLSANRYVLLQSVLRRQLQSSALPLELLSVNRRGGRSGCSAQVKEEPEGRGTRSRTPAAASSERKQKLLGARKN